MRRVQRPTHVNCTGLWTTACGRTRIDSTDDRTADELQLPTVRAISTFHRGRLAGPCREIATSTADLNGANTRRNCSGCGDLTGGAGEHRTPRAANFLQSREWQTTIGTRGLEDFARSWITHLT